MNQSASALLNSKDPKDLKDPIAPYPPRYRMKRYITSLLVALLLGSAVAMAEGPGIEFSVTSHDFGNIDEDGDPVSCEFEFTNTGDEPLVIVSANASCGCTRPEFPKKPIKPGKTGKIKVTYLPKGRPEIGRAHV